MGAMDVQHDTHTHYVQQHTHTHTHAHPGVREEALAVPMDITHSSPAAHHYIESDTGDTYMFTDAAADPLRTFSYTHMSTDGAASAYSLTSVATGPCDDLTLAMMDMPTPCPWPWSTPLLTGAGCLLASSAPSPPRLDGPAPAHLLTSVATGAGQELELTHAISMDMATRDTHLLTAVSEDVAAGHPRVPTGANYLLASFPPNPHRPPGDPTGGARMWADGRAPLLASVADDLLTISETHTSTDDAAPAYLLPSVVADSFSLSSAPPSATDPLLTSFSPPFALPVLRHTGDDCMLSDAAPASLFTTLYLTRASLDGTIAPS